jgi:5-methylcytosine-specific restriction endonuclease McrA
MLCEHNPKHAKGMCKICWSKEYNQRPEVKARLKKYYQSPKRKAYTKKYQKEYYQRPEIKERQNKFLKLHFKEIKFRHIQEMGGKCMLCGYDKNVAALDIHHKNSKEKESRKDAQKAILDYTHFLLLCANCHREEHHPELSMNLVKEHFIPSKETDVI